MGRLLLLLLMLLLGSSSVVAGQILDIGSFQVQLIDLGEAAQGGAGCAFGFPSTITGGASWTPDQVQAVIRSFEEVDQWFDTPAGRPIRIAVSMKDLGTAYGDTNTTIRFNNEMTRASTTAEAALRDGASDDPFPLAADALIRMTTRDITWHLGPSAPDTHGTKDFQSTLVHEIVHALGMRTGYINPESGYPYGLTRWDTLMRDQSGNTPEAGSTGTPNPMVVTGPYGTVFWTGANANATYGGPVPIYTKEGLFTPGSPLNHTARSGELMSPSHWEMQLTRAPGKLLLDMFKDMGWSVNPEFYNAFGPTFYRTGKEIRHGDTFVSNADYAYAMYVNGSKNQMTLGGELTASGRYSKTAYLFGAANAVDITGTLVSTGDWSTALYHFGYNTRINHRGIIRATGLFSPGIILQGHNNQLWHTGTTAAIGGGPAIQVDNPFNGPGSLISIGGSSIIMGDIVNTHPEIPALIRFGETDEGSGSRPDPEFNFVFADDIRGLWQGRLVSGVTRFNGTASFDGLVVENPATLGGCGEIIADVTNHGRISPGNSIDTLTITGDYTHKAGSVLEIESGPDGTDRLTITGTAALEGGTLALVPSGYLPGGTLSFLSAGDITGHFFQLQTPAVFNAALFSTADTLSMTVTRNAYADIAPSGQAGLANILDRQRASATGDMALVLNTLDTLDLPGFNGAVQDMGPGFYNAVSAGAMDDIRIRNGIIKKQLTRTCPGGGSAWLETLGAHAGYDADARSLAVDKQLAGTLFGGQQSIYPGVDMGAAGGVTRTRTREEAGSGTAQIRTLTAYVYGTWHKGLDGLYGYADAGLGRNHYDTRRGIDFLHRQVGDKYSGWYGTALVGGGYQWRLGNLNLRPGAGLEFIYLDEQSVTEQNGGATGLDIADRSTTVLGSSLSAAASWDLSWGRIRIMPQFECQWHHRLKTSRQDPAATFQQTRDLFISPQPSLIRDMFDLDFGFTATMATGMTGFMTYRYSFDADQRYRADQIRLGLTLAF